jgi:deoxycytidine triphosphate deaminase
MRLSEVLLAKNSIAITVFDPLNIDVLKKYERDNPEVEIITVGLDTIKNIDEQTDRVGATSSRIMTASEFDQAIEATRKADVVLEGDVQQILDGTLAAISLLSGRGGIVSKDHMLPLFRAGSLIRRGTEGNVKSASYDLQIGSQVWCGGKLIQLTDQSPTFTVPPYSYAIVIAKEDAYLPTFIAGSFDIKVSLFLRGMILSNGPQVDPGYKGQLFCMLFNGSSDPRTLAKDSHFATIQFVTTTHKSEAYADRYQLQKRLEAIMAEGGLSGQGGNIVKDFSDRIERTNSRLDNVAYWAIGSAAALIVAVLGVALWIADRVSDAKVTVAQVEQMGKQQLDNIEKSNEEIRRSQAAANQTFQLSVSEFETRFLDAVQQVESSHKKASDEFKKAQEQGLSELKDATDDGLRKLAAPTELPRRF